MTQQQADYIVESKEALEMLGKGYEPSLEIEAPRKVTTRRGGKLLEEDRPAFVKIYTDFKDELKTIEAADLKVWIYLALSINHHTNDARPGLRKIAEDLGMAVNTVQVCLERLEAKNLLDIEQSAGKGNIYHPADYASISKGVSKIDTVKHLTVSKNPGTVSTQYRKIAQLEELEDSSSSNSGDIFKIFEQEIGALTPMIADAIRDAEKTYPPDWIHEAIQIAVANNKRNWSYVEGILKNCKAKNTRPALSRLERPNGNHAKKQKSASKYHAPELTPEQEERAFAQAALLLEIKS